MNNKYYIEKFKDIILVVLVFTTILLLYFLWGNDRSIEDIIFSDDTPQAQNLELKQVIQPDRIAVNNGNEDYILARYNKSGLWFDYLIPAVAKFSAGANLLVEEISQEQYNEIFKYPSVSAQFNYDLPFSDFCSRFGITASAGFDTISSITQIGFSNGSRESMFIFDGQKNKYYRIVGNAPFDIVSKVTDTVNESQSITFFELKSFLGEDSTNTTLIPIDFNKVLPKLSYTNDFMDFDSDTLADSLAKPYFGETFNFVRKVQEADGTTIYMYGYGQKVLIINPNEGSLEYKAEIKDFSTKNESIFDSLEIAMTFINSHGSFRTNEGHLLDLALADISSLDDKKKGYRFSFNLKVNSTDVFYFRGAPLIIEVQDGQVSYFKKNFLNFTESDETASEGDTLSAINMIAENYEYIYNALEAADYIHEDLENLTFDLLANRIDEVSIGYLLPNSDLNREGSSSLEGELLPVWKIRIGTIVFYFDLYENEPLGYSKGV